MTSPDASCIFCRIVAGDVPAEVLGRSEHAMSIRDVHPQAPFHALVLPLQHHENAAASAGAAWPRTGGKVSGSPSAVAW